MAAGEKRVYIYSKGVPGSTGSGSRVRHYTNIRSYLDLGYAVDFVHFQNLNRDVEGVETCVRSVGATWRKLEELPDARSSLERAAYYLGFPRSKSLNGLFPGRRLVQQEVYANERRTPGALHHFEYLDTASAAIGLDSRLTTIWSCHDLQSKRYRQLLAMREEAGTSTSRWQRRKQMLLCGVERELAHTCDLVFTIAEDERNYLQANYGAQNAVLLPMSWSSEQQPPRQRPWMENGRLRLLHVGSIGNFVGYYSLRFLLEEVISKLSRPVLEQIEVYVAGKDSGNYYAKEIKQLAAAYPRVEFLGYVDDLDALYATCDLHFVGSGPFTGLRTRVIESWVKGLPVLMHRCSAGGFVDLEPGRMIFVESDAEATARRIEYIHAHPDCLPEISRAGRAFYEQRYSRAASSQVMAEAIHRYLGL